MKNLRFVSAAALAAALVLVPSVSRAAPPTKEECVETHSRAQDQREKGQLADAKRLFLLCAQQSCPALVQSDCAKFGEELSRSVPSISFSARDGKGSDVQDVQVFVDGQLVSSRLDDGKAHDVDPGKHTVRFVRGGKEVVVSVVVAVGEKGRNVSATFSDGAPAQAAGGTADSPKRDADTSASHTPSRPVFPLVVAGIGGAALATGVVLTFVGLGGVPDQCDRSSNQCAAAPGDPVFSDAESAVNTANIGIGVGIAGLVVGLGGLIWYLSSSPSEPSTTSARVMPKILPWSTGRDSGGSFRVSF